MRKQSVLPIFIVALLAPLVSSCLFSPPEKPPIDTPPVTYLPYTTPDNLAENFRRAWQAMDVRVYRDSILFNSDRDVAEDGEEYPTFAFYFSEGIDLWGHELPQDPQTYEQEVDNVSRMFSGDSGHGPNGEEIPGVESISLLLDKNQNWSNPPNPDYVEGDPYPAGTKRVIYETDMTITLKGTLPPPLNTETTAFLVKDRLEFHAIPVVVGQGTPNAHREYKLWKWRDFEVDD